MQGLRLAFLEVLLYVFFYIGGTLFFTDAKVGFEHTFAIVMLLVTNVLAIGTAILELNGLPKFFGALIYYGGIIVTFKLFLFP